MTAKKRILIVSFSDIKRDPRVYRQVKHLCPLYDVVTLGFKTSGLEGVDFIPILEKGNSLPKKVLRAMRLKAHDYPGYYNATFDIERVRESLKGQRFDLILANDSDSLPLVFSWDHGTPVLHDAHEYAPRQIEDQWWWRFLMQDYMDWICKTYLTRCAEITTVSQGIANEYSRNYGVRPKVITSAPDFVDLKPSAVEEGRIRLVHHGNANPNRKIENYLDLMDLLDERFNLDLYLMPRDPSYLTRIKRKAAACKRVKVLDPVPMQDLVHTCNKYDIGMFLQEPLNFNLKNSLPNKFFEFVQARLLVAVTPLPEIERYVHDLDLGLVSKGFTPESMAKELLGLDRKKVEHYKLQSHLHAMELSSGPNLALLDGLVDNLIAKG
jgi:hypothetical protein